MRQGDNFTYTNGPLTLFTALLEVEIETVKTLQGKVFYRSSRVEIIRTDY